jgi:hypothetical protein
VAGGNDADVVGIWIAAGESRTSFRGHRILTTT